MTKRREVVRLLEINGFVNEGGKRHDKFKHQDGRWTEVPRHREIDNYLVEVIKKQVGL